MKDSMKDSMNVLINGEFDGRKIISLMFREDISDVP